MVEQTLSPTHRLILASTSPFRRDLLARLELPFETRVPQVDETPLPDEEAPTLVLRLATAKAVAVAASEVNALIIGSDQVAVLEGFILGKPGNHERARHQLNLASGKTVTFYTGLCLVNSETGIKQRAIVPFRVVFRKLKAQQIENYLCREKPYQCAGSFKSEGLGIALFEKMQGADPSSLIGLPLIRLIRMLEAEGVTAI